MLLISTSAGPLSTACAVKNVTGLQTDLVSERWTAAARSSRGFNRADGERRPGEKRRAAERRRRLSICCHGDQFPLAAELVSSWFISIFTADLFKKNPFTVLQFCRSCSRVCSPGCRSAVPSVIKPLKSSTLSLSYSSLLITS